MELLFVGVEAGKATTNDKVIASWVPFKKAPPPKSCRFHRTQQSTSVRQGENDISKFCKTMLKLYSWKKNQNIGNQQAQLACFLNLLIPGGINFHSTIII